MARKTADTSMPDFIDWDTTKEVEGYYVALTHGIPSRFGDFSTVTIKTDDDTKVSAVLSLELRRAFEPIPPGAHVWITYKGKEKLPNGNKITRFEVDYDDEDLIDVSPLAFSTQQATAKAPVAEDEEPF